MSSLEPDPALASTGVRVPPPARVRSPLSDGEWHRLHPLTPLLRGGLVLLVVAGIVISNLRDRLIDTFLPGGVDVEGDPIDYVFEHDLVFIVLGLVLLGVLIVVALFYVSWRFHTFRVTGDDVEVRSGVLFRTQRRAPLDRVQGVNLTRPMIARLLGAAKLEVVGAGSDGNVKLEYLSTQNAETIRGDILRLASGRQLGEASEDEPAAGAPSRHAAVGETVSAGFTGLIDGVDLDDAEPESVVHIPVLRLLASHVLSGTTITLIALLIGIVVASVLGHPVVLVSLVPTLIGFGAYWIRQVTKTLRYSVAPTSAGVRFTFGLFTTITETIPPGRIHAVEVRQSVLWRPFGWWSVRVNRLSGRSMSDNATLQFSEVLPIGTRADVERVLRLILPAVPDEQWSGLFAHGILGPERDDPFTNTTRRGRWLRPLSWRRNGFLLTPDALLLRRGAIWRSLVLLPLARLQSLRLEQGPLERMLGVAGITGHTVLGQVTAQLGAIDRDDAVALWQGTAATAALAAAGDTSHRWDAAIIAPPTAGAEPEPSASERDAAASKADSSASEREAQA